MSLDLGRLDAADRGRSRARACARVRAGMRLPELDHALGAHGLRLGHLPQSYEWATVGGCAATRSAGQASTGFGRFEDLVAAVRCATPAGELATLGAPASAAGPDLRALVLGSEGTLGAITELDLRVRPVAAEHRYEAWLLRSFEAGCEALRALAQAERRARRRAAVRRARHPRDVRARRARAPSCAAPAGRRCARCATGPAACWSRAGRGRRATSHAGARPPRGC